LDEDDLIRWQDVLDEINAGRTAGLACPFCDHVPLEVASLPMGVTRISCSRCRNHIEGRFVAN
jgi:hypothetical protein